jgi:formate--tetrahydrofolate ligase
MADSRSGHSAGPRPIRDIAAELGFLEDEIVPYGRSIAKIALSARDRIKDRPLGHYVLVTAITPTPFGEGKTTTAIGLAMALSRQGRRAAVTLRQPSLGPVFGIKGGGAGGGRAQVVPAEAINLHFTGDAHAVAAAHNLLSAFLDNHLFHGNALGLDPERLTWPRAASVSDRSLRRVGSAPGGSPRAVEFVITEASEVMAVLALATDLRDLRERLGRIVVGFAKNGRPVTAEALHCAGAMAALLTDALSPNLVQTIEGTPAFVHTGPFGNIAHGASSVVADAMALRCCDYVVTEAGFGSDLGAEKFFDIKCRVSGLRPRAAVVVVTLRALKLHGGAGPVKSGAPLPPGLTTPNRTALEKGLANLEQHLANVAAFGVPAVVAINAFPGDSAEELASVRERAMGLGAIAAPVCTHWSDGSKGAEELADSVVRACRQPAEVRLLYADSAPITEKIETIARRMYGAASVVYEGAAGAQIEAATKSGFGRWPICMAKTPLSLSHDPALVGRPTGFTLPVKEVRVLAGAGFLTALCSGIQLMPGLPGAPAGEGVDIDPVTGRILGLS